VAFLKDTPGDTSRSDFQIADFAMNELKRENLELKAGAQAFYDEERRRWALDFALITLRHGQASPHEVEKTASRYVRFAQTGEFDQGDAI